MAKQPPKPAEKAASKPVRERKRVANANTAKRKPCAGDSSKDTRFKPGQSGNPKGRPRKERSLLKHIEEELDAEMQVTENGKTIRLTKRQALAKLIVNKALQEDDKKLTQLLRLLPTEKDDGADDHAAIPLETILRFLMRKGGVDTADGHDKGEGQ
jgi:hypothetical protein